MSRSSGDNVINNAEWQAIQGDLELWWNLLFEDLLLESLVGGEQAGGGLVPVFLHHLGHDRLVDSPGVKNKDTVRSQGDSKPAANPVNIPTP